LILNNCLILGFGRSGTSLLGGLLYHSGYFAGNHLHPPRATNPKGFYEDIIINRINEQILEPFDYAKHHSTYPVYSKEFSPYHPRRGHRWLTWIEPGTLISNQDEYIKSLIRDAVAQQQPFAFKDPRFNYTLPVWMEFLPENTRFLCIFRNPATVVRSVITECNSIEYLSEFHIDEALCFQVWYNSYRHFLDTMTEEIRAKTLFLPYEGLIQNQYLDKISQLLNAGINKDFIEPSLNRTKPTGAMPANVSRVYAALIALAGK
jgi:hypothetical protein